MSLLLPAKYAGIVACSRVLQALDAEILDDRVGEKLAAHLLDRGVLGAVGEVEFDQLPRADIVDAGKTEALERVVDGLALGVEHTGLQGDEHARFHANSPLPKGGVAPLWPASREGARLYPLFTVNGASS